MDNGENFNFSACMDNAKKSVVTILEDRLEKMTASLDNINKATGQALKSNKTKILNASTKILNKNRSLPKFKPRKSDSKALSFKMALARRKFAKYKTLKQRSNKTLYYFGGFKRFKCNKCAKIFKYESNSNRHSCVHSIQSNRSSHFEINSRNHLGKKQYKCDECEKEFFWPSHLTIHKRCHTNEKPYACDYCEKKCTLLSNLKIHLRVHTGERPYSCDQCGMKYSHRSSLINHVSKNH